MRTNFTAFVHDRLQEMVDNARYLAHADGSQKHFKRAFTRMNNEFSELTSLHRSYLKQLRILRDHTHEWNDDPASDHSCVICGMPYKGDKL